MNEKIRFECGALCKQRDHCMDGVKEPTAYSLIFYTIVYNCDTQMAFIMTCWREEEKKNNLFILFSGKYTVHRSVLFHLCIILLAFFFIRRCRRKNA